MISANFSCYMSPCQFGQNMHLASLAAPWCYFVLDIDIETAGAGCGDSGDMYRMSRIPSSLPTLHITCYVKHGHAPHSSSCVFTLSFRLCFGNNPIMCPLALHTILSVSELSQVAVRGAAAEVPLQQAGLQPRPARRDGGQDPPLVQLHQLAADGVRQDQARVHPRPARRVRQGENQDHQETVRIYHQPRTGLETADILQSCRQQCSQIIWASFNI